MSVNAGTKFQGKKQDTAHSKQNQSRGSRKWATNTSTNVLNGGSGRNTSHSTVGLTNNMPSGHTQHSSPVVEDPDLIYHMHDRMLFLLGNLYGSKVQVTVRNGIKYEGLFQGATSEGDLGVSLTLARKIHDPTLTDKSKPSLQQPVLPALLILSKDLVEITALDTDLTAGELAHQEKDSFKTDADISGKGEFKERELHKWNPEVPESGVLESLEDGSLESGMGSSGNTGGSWDQFAANEKLFGLKTDFDEEMYTTRLDRSAPDYKDREKWAIEKANEIQRSTTKNPHMLEERNQATADDSGMDEEDRYGAVVRGSSSKETKENVYVPPALRSKQQPVPPKSQDQQPAHFANFPPGSPLHKLTTGTLTTASPSSSSYRHESSTTTSTATITTTTTAITNSKSKKSTNDKQQAPKRIESEIANTFRQFALIEKDKLKAKRQALHKKEQSDRLAELVKFHQSFKLDVPIPPDLLPLLAKGKKSPTLSQSSNSPPQQQETPPNTATSTTKHTSSDSTGAAKKSGFKFNIKASEFRPNPAAASFVPGGVKLAGAATSSEESTGFAGRSLKKEPINDPVSMEEFFKEPFAKNKHKKPSSIGPTWPYGSKQYRHQFNQYNPYSEDIYTGYPAPAYGYGYPHYRYHQQYVPGMPVQPQNVSYMSPPFVPNVPISAAPMHPDATYSPQMPNGSPHGSPFPQGYSSPQRSPMPPPTGGSPQGYPYYQTSPSIPPPRYTPPEMMSPPVMMPPVMPNDQHPSQYPMSRPPQEQMSPTSQPDSVPGP